MKRILVTAIMFGYGPIVTSINVLKSLKKHKDIIVDFIGDGITLEQAKTSKLFNRIYKLNGYENLVKREQLFLSYDALFSVEDDKIAIYAKNIGVKKVYYLDNLMWMWDNVHPTLLLADKFFISETIPCKENINRHHIDIKNPVFIGPVRNINHSSIIQKENKLIINIGGADSFMFDNILVVNFYIKLINLIISIPNFVNRFDEIIVCGGSSVIQKLNIDVPNIKVVSLAYNEYLAELATASHCILAPGLGNFSETISYNKNILFLPAINYSQFLQTKFYSSLKLGLYLLGWRTFNFAKDIPEFLDEQLGVDLVMDNVKKFLEEDVTELVRMEIIKYINTPQNEYFSSRNKYVRNKYTNSAPIVADIIYSDLGGEN